MNIWKTITIVLLFIACLLFIIWYKEIYNAKADFQEQVQICSIDEGKCVTLRKVGG